MKIGLIIPSNIWFCPYINIYTNCLKKYNISYDIISWNRLGGDLEEGYQYYNPIQNTKIKKLLTIIKYVNYVKRIVLKEKYDKLIVSGSTIGIFLNKFLQKFYKKNYIFDFRDLSVEQYFILHKPFENLLANSFVNFVSSPGFKKCLPTSFDYALSHNFDIDKVKDAILNNTTKTKKNGDKITILTIGGIRDYASNVEVIKSLANNSLFELYFVGKGPESENLRNFVQDNNIKNVKFHGYYDKRQEADFIEKADFMNIFYPNILSHNTALSNRFYSSLIYNKPMIVTSNSIQGDYVEKYNLGISIDDCDHLDKKLIDYLLLNNLDDLEGRTKELLKLFLNDYLHFETVMKNFIRNQ